MLFSRYSWSSSCQRKMPCPIVRTLLTTDKLTTTVPECIRFRTMKGVHSKANTTRKQQFPPTISLHAALAFRAHETTVPCSGLRKAARYDLARAFAERALRRPEGHSPICCAWHDAARFGNMLLHGARSWCVCALREDAEADTHLHCRCAWNICRNLLDSWQPATSQHGGCVAANWSCHWHRTDDISGLVRQLQTEWARHQLRASTLWSWHLQWIGNKEAVSERAANKAWDEWQAWPTNLPHPLMIVNKIHVASGKDAHHAAPCVRKRRKTLRGPHPRLQDNH